MSKQQYNFSNYWLVFMPAILVGIIIGAWVAAEGYIDRDGSCPINIPNDAWADNFCKVMGYNFGWLSSTSCEWNEVMCHDEFAGYERNDCIHVGETS